MSRKNTFRPYLTLEEIEKIISLASEHIEDEVCVSVYKKCKALTFKIAEQIVTPSYVIKRTSLEESLGFSDETAEGLGKLVEEMYEIWNNPERRKELTLSELQLVSEYRYTNDLMTPEEESEYEAKLLSAS